MSSITEKSMQLIDLSEFVNENKNDKKSIN